MIKVLYKGGRFAPRFVCDACGELIEDVQMAASINPNVGLAEDELVPVYHAHKRACHRAIDARIRAEGGSPGWDELTRHIELLVRQFNGLSQYIAWADSDPDEPTLNDLP